MSDQTNTTAGGLRQPAKRGRPRKDERSSGPENGSIELAGGNEEPVSGTEGTDATESAPLGKPATGGYTPIDPLSIASDGDNGDRPRRGRKAGGKNKPKEETVSNLSALLKIERLLVTTCFFLGNVLESPELHISESEAAEVSDALKELSKHYPIGMSEKSIAWVNFSFAIGGVFGPKVVAIYKRPRPRMVPTPIRPVEAPPITRKAPEPGPYAAAPATDGMLNGLANPVSGEGLTPEHAQVPSQMWNQPGDIQDID